MRVLNGAFSSDQELRRYIQISISVKIKVLIEDIKDLEELIEEHDFYKNIEGYAIQDTRLPLGWKSLTVKEAKQLLAQTLEAYNLLFSILEDAAEISGRHMKIILLSMN